MNDTTKKVLLAFSGGLDTSYCVVYLRHELGLDVHTAIVQTGGFTEEELQNIEQRALALGASSHTTIDETSALYSECLRFLVFGNVLKNNTYPLSVSAERVFQARAIARLASEGGYQYVAHGSTGAGNDQVRFDVVFRTALPDTEILTPIRDNKLSREDEISYLKSKGVEGDWTKAQYSINQGIWGTTIGGRETLSSSQPLPSEAYPSQCTNTEPQTLHLHFERGEFVGLNGTRYDHPVDAIRELARIAGAYAIGRDIHVGDTIIGTKGRVAFEAAAPLMIIKAHHALEKHTLTRWQLNLKDQMSLWYGQLLHEGQFAEPAMRSIEAFFADTQVPVSGIVHVECAPYRFAVSGVDSPSDMMRSEFGSYGEMNTLYTGDDVRGYSRIVSNQSRIYQAVNGDRS